MGMGAEFIVRLPLAETSRETSDGPSPDGAAPEASRGLRILVVDDNPALVAMFATLLRLSGHDLETALNGTEALDRCMSFQPDVVLLDVGLPGLDGFAIARELRRRDGGHDLRIIGISGYGHKEYQDIGKEAGFDAYLVKPVDQDELERLLTTFMQNRKSAG